MARFPDADITELDRAKTLGVRSGTTHRFTAVWVVVVERRVFVRSWNDKPTGWYRAFLREPRGAVTVDRKQLAVRGRQLRSERLRHAVSAAYAKKYPTKGSAQWVRGFAEAHREATTLELVPDDA